MIFSDTSFALSWWMYFSVSNPRPPKSSVLPIEFACYLDWVAIRRQGINMCQNKTLLATYCSNNVGLFRIIYALWIGTADDSIFRWVTGRNAVALSGAISVGVFITFSIRFAWNHTIQKVLFVNCLPFRRQSWITLSLANHIFGVVITSILKRQLNASKNFWG